MTAREDLFAQELLASAKGDALSPSRKAAMSTALGLGAAGVGMGIAGVGAAAGKAKLALGLTLLKWLGVVTAGGIAVATATTALVHHSERVDLEVAQHERQRALPPAAIAPLGTTAAAPVATAVAEVESASMKPLPVATAVVKAAPSAETVVEETPAPAAPSARLATEQRTIEAARRAVAGGDLEGAQRALAAHDAAFPHGAFAEEAEVLRIELLARSGQHEAARRAASSLLARAPESPYASRLRELVGD